MFKTAIVTSGYFPISPVLGGAVESLVLSLIETNEDKGKTNFVIYSCSNDKAQELSQRYSNSTFVFIDTPSFIQLADKIIYFISKRLLHKEKHLSYRFILQRLHYIWAVGRHLSKNDVDKVVFENHPTLLGALRISDNESHYKDRVYYHMHNLLPSFFGLKKELMGCRRILGVSDYVLNELYSASGEELNRSQLVKVANKVDESQFTGKLSADKNRELRQKHGIPESSPIVLFGGRLCEEKGALELIKAFGLLPQRNATLLILGSYYYGSGMKSSYELELEECAKELGDRIKFTGFIDHDAMPDYYALADVVVAPSVWDDPAPLAVIEPLTCGKPLITTKMGGIPEYASDNIDAIVLPVDANLISGLANAIESVLSGRIKLSRKKDSDWSVDSFYFDFLNALDD